VSKPKASGGGCAGKPKDNFSLRRAENYGAGRSHRKQKEWNMTPTRGSGGIDNPSSGTAHDQVNDRTDLKAASDQPGSLEANLADNATLEIDTKLGKVTVEAAGQLGIDAETQAAEGERLSAKSGLKVKAHLRKNELDVIVTDKDRIKATGKSPGEMKVSVDDQLGIKVEAPDNVNVVLKTRDRDRVTTRAPHEMQQPSKRPDFLEHADSDKPWDV
jgi:hypothetical protein